MCVCVEFKVCNVMGYYVCVISWRKWGGMGEREREGKGKRKEGINNLCLSLFHYTHTHSGQCIQRSSCGRLGSWHHSVCLYLWEGKLRERERERAVKVILVWFSVYVVIVQYA